MFRYEVAPFKEEKKYGVNDYFTKYGDKKVLGIIGRRKCIFEFDIGDHWGRISEYTKEVGPINLWYIPDNSRGNTLYINYSTSFFNQEFASNSVTPFQYECVMGILNEVKACGTSEQPIKASIPSVLFSDNQKRTVVYPFQEELIYPIDKNSSVIETIDQVLVELKLEYEKVLEMDKPKPFDIGESFENVPKGRGK